MAMADNNGNDTHPIEAEGNTGGFTIVWVIICTFLGAVGAVIGVLKYPNEFKLVILGLVALFWILFEFNNRLKTAILNLIWKRVQQRQGVPSDTQRKSQVPAVRWGLGVLLVLFLLGWGYGKCNEAPTIAGTISYMVVLDASDAMREPFDMYPSKWAAVQEAFQDFYDRSHPDSHYGLVLIGGQNPQEGNGTTCSLPTVPLIPVVSGNGKALPHRKLTLPNLQDQVEGQQPQGGGSLSRAFFLAKNHLESLKSDEPISSLVIVLIANASDSCAGRIDWDTLASEIERVNRTISVRKELILIDVDASPETVAFAEKMNAMDEAAGTYNTFVQVVSNDYELELSVSNVVDRNQDAVEQFQMAATATAQSEASPIIVPVTGGQGPATFVTFTPKPRKVVVAASATSTLTLTPTATSTLTSSPTFPSTATCTFAPSAMTLTTSLTPTLSFTPTATAIVYTPPTRTRRPPPTPTPLPPPPPIDTCCRHCGPDSKPCGDSCISLEYECHQPPGCACE